MSVRNLLVISNEQNKRRLRVAEKEIYVASSVFCNTSEWASSSTFRARSERSTHLATSVIRKKKQSWCIMVQHVCLSLFRWVKEHIFSNSSYNNNVYICNTLYNVYQFSAHCHVFIEESREDANERTFIRVLYWDGVQLGKCRGVQKGSFLSVDWVKVHVLEILKMFLNLMVVWQDVKLKLVSWCCSTYTSYSPT